MDTNIYCPELKAELKKDRIVSIQVKQAADSVDFFRQIWEGIDIYESFVCLYLNQANKTIGWYKVAQGGVSGVFVDPKLILKKAIEVLATGIIICHNHPSGNTNPSKADIALTTKLKGGCEFFDIRLMDHVIITENSYYSFGETGIL